MFAAGSWSPTFPIWRLSVHSSPNNDQAGDQAGTWRSPLEAAAERRLPALQELRSRAGVQLGHPGRRSASALRLLPADARHPGPRDRRLPPGVVPPRSREAPAGLHAASAWVFRSSAATRIPERGLAFEFKADDPNGTAVLTGHAGGLITINVAEADDAERERRRTSLHEPFRTLAGHFRHESGHYYWDRLIGGPRRARRISRGIRRRTIRLRRGA